MEKRLPKKAEYIPLSDKAKYRIVGNNVYFKLNDTNITLDVADMIRSKRWNEVGLQFSGTIKTLNILLTQLSNISFDSKVVIFLDQSVKISKNTFLALDYLKDNVKINIWSESGDDPKELNSWCINLSDKDFARIYDKINDREHASKLRREREIGKIVYLELSKHYDFSTMSDTDKMNLMFDWVVKNFPYDTNLIGRDGNYLDNVDRSLGSDPSKVFARRKGVCTGRSRLLKILLNNQYMKVNCYTVSGMVGHLGHQWNEFIDEFGNVYAYDTSYARAGIRHVGDITKCGIGHREIVHSHIVEKKLRDKTDQLIQNSTSLCSPGKRASSTVETPPLPPRRPFKKALGKRKNPPPLPPRKKN